MWCCSSDWVDQFCNPGHQAPHHVKQRLGICENALSYGTGKLKQFIFFSISLLMQKMSLQKCYVSSKADDKSQMKIKWATTRENVPSDKILTIREISMIRLRNVSKV